jgi:hypothetical protein
MASATLYRARGKLCRGTGAGRHHARAAGGILGLVLVVFLVLWLLGALGVHHA